MKYSDKLNITTVQQEGSAHLLFWSWKEHGRRLPLSAADCAALSISEEGSRELSEVRWVRSPSRNMWIVARAGDCLAYGEVQDGAGIAAIQRLTGSSDDLHMSSSLARDGGG